MNIFNGVLLSAVCCLENECRVTKKQLDYRDEINDNTTNVVPDLSISPLRISLCTQH